MKNLGYIASEITKGKNLSDNLVKYGKGLSSLYNGLAYIKMSSRRAFLAALLL